MLPESPFFQEYFQILQQSPLCRGLNRLTLEDMLKLFTRKTIAKGTYLSREESRESFHIVISGRLELTRIHPETGRTVTLWLLGPGDGYDIITLLDGKSHDILPVVLDDVETLTTSLSTVREWISRHPEFNRCFLPYVAERMRQLEDLSSDLVLHDTVTRLARLILHYVDLKNSSSATGKYPLRLINDFSHDTLACMVGSVRTVVNRHLQHLKKEGAVDFHRGQLTVKNLEILASQAGTYLHEQKNKYPESVSGHLCRSWK